MDFPVTANKPFFDYWLKNISLDFHEPFTVNKPPSWIFLYLFTANKLPPWTLLYETQLILTEPETTLLLDTENNLNQDSFQHAK